MQKKIAVIGGGISGLTTAYYLQQRGHLVTLFEKEMYVGGKCRTLKHHGNICELGCVFGASSHKNLLKLMKKLGIKNEGAYFYRSFSTLQGKRTAQVKKQKLAEFKKQYSRFPEILKKYNSILKKPGLTKIPPELCINFSNWCQKNNLGELAAVFAPPFTGLGYGRIDQIPAAYALKHFDISTLNSFINVKKNISFPDGSYSLCEKLSDYINDVRLNSEVIRIETGNQVIVKTNLETEKFDAAVLTVQLPQGSIENEKFEKILSKYQYTYYNTLAYKVLNPPHVNTYFPENFYKEDGHLLAYFNRNPQSKDSVISGYSYGNIESSKLKSMMDEDLKNAGIHLKSIFALQKWKNFPHVTCEEMQNGFYDKLDALQGSGGIYCAGGLVCFPNFDKLIEYADYFAEKYF